MNNDYVTTAKIILSVAKNLVNSLDIQEVKTTEPDKKEIEFRNTVLYEIDKIFQQVQAIKLDMRFKNMQSEAGTLDDVLSKLKNLYSLMRSH